MFSTPERVKGVLVGLAAGDRNGGPIRMALELTESLAASGRFEPTAILNRYLRWWQTEGFDTGPIADRVFTLITEGAEPAAAVEQAHLASGGLTAGCNPAHRSAPLAMAAFLPDDQLAQCAYADAELTHKDPLAGDVAAAMIRLCRALIRGETWPAALSLAREGRAELTVAALDVTSNAPLYSDGFTPHVLHAAVHFVHTNDHFGDVLDSALQFAGGANYCPVLVGAIGGARWGVEQIDSQYLRHCDILPSVLQVAGKLAQQWRE